MMNGTSWQVLENGLNRPSLGKDYRRWVENLEVERKQAITNMVESVLLPFKAYNIPVDSTTHNSKWIVKDPWPYMFLVMKQKDFDRIAENEFLIRASVHQKGNQANMLYLSSPINIRASDFNPSRNKPVPRPDKGDNLVWYVADMTGYAEMYPDKLADLKETLKNIDSMQQVME